MLLPVGIEGAGVRRLPRATLILLSANLLIYLLCVLLDLKSGAHLTDSILGPSDSTLQPWAMTPSNLRLVTIFTSPWIHLDVLHLAANCLFLWVFGSAVESAMGGLTVLAVYVSGGVMSALVQLSATQCGVAASDVSYAGSSGAVIALMVAITMRRYRARVRLWMILGEAAIPVWVILAAFVGWYWIAPALNPGPSGPSGYWGHLGGAAAGFAFALCAGLVTHGAIDYSMEDALTLISKGQLKAGLQVLHALLKARPDDTRVPLALAREYVKVWDRDAGARYYALSIRKELDAGRLDNAIADWDEAVASQVPLTARHALPLANAAQQAGKIETALKLYEWAAPLADETTRAVIAARIEAIRRGVR